MQYDYDSSEADGPLRPRMLSVANVASAVGGTGRCAVDCVLALPHWEHAMVLLSGCAHGARTIREEAGWIQLWLGKGRVAQVVKEWQPELVLYHNTGRDQMPDLGRTPTAYYHHSAHTGRPAKTALVVSHALAARLGRPAEQVLHQPVSPPPNPDGFGRETRFTVGRLCTPRASKWPAEVVPFYARLADRFTEIWWEFVGAPPGIEQQLRAACRGRCAFHVAGPSARAHLWRWHATVYDGPWESYGRVACEAQQAGCVPVVNRRGGLAEQIRHGVDGYLCDTPADFDAALNELRYGLSWHKASLAARRAGTARGSLEPWGREFARRVGVPYGDEREAVA